MRCPKVSLAVLALCGCSPSSDSRHQFAPFEARLGSVEFSFTRDAMFYQAGVARRHNGDAYYVHFKLCGAPEIDRKKVRSCDLLDFLPINRGQVYVVLHAPHPLTRFSTITERPQVKAPYREPLVTTSLRLDRPLGIPGEQYQILRIGGIDGVIQTTSNNWPLVGCKRNGSYYGCRLGFALQDVFVEASWTFTSDRDLDQRQLWSIATVVDAAVRSRVTGVQSTTPKTAASPAPIS